MTGPFDIPEGMPRIEHAIVDEQTQMQRYLAEIAMDDLLRLPHPSARKVRPGSLAEAYQKSVAAEHALEAANERAQVTDVEEIIVSEVSRTSVPSVGPPPRDMNKEVREFIPGREQPVETITLYSTETGEPFEVAIKDPREAAEFKGE